MTVQPTEQANALDQFEEIDEIELGSSSESLEQAAYTLWRKAISFGTWDPAKIDLSHDREQYLGLDKSLQVYLEHFCGAFYNAEENVARVFCPWIMSATTTWQQAYLSTQLVEEFKHTEFFIRYFKEVFGLEAPRVALANPVHNTLHDRADRLLSSLSANEDERTMTLVESVTHYQGIIEGVQANTGYQIFVHVFAKKGLLPGLSEGFRNIQRDEGRHVSFGLQMLRHYAGKSARYANRIREIYEAYLPYIESRYNQTLVVDGVEYTPPADERGAERIMAMYNRKIRDIFGD